MKHSLVTLSRPAIPPEVQKFAVEKGSGGISKPTNSLLRPGHATDGFAIAKVNAA
jgi:hypothetical protein